MNDAAFEAYLSSSPIPEAWSWRELRGNVHRVERVSVPTMSVEASRRPMAKMEIMVFDEEGRLLELDRGIGGLPERIVNRREYDGAGRMVTLSSFRLEPLKDSSQPFVRTSLRDVISYSYTSDQHGNVTAWTGRSSMSNEIFEQTTVNQEANGRVWRVTKYRSGTEEVVSSRRRPDDTTVITVSRTLNGKAVPIWSILAGPDDQPDSRVVFKPNGDVMFMEFYTDGRVTSVERKLEGKSMLTLYTYDLDSHGNWIRKSRKGGPVLEERTITYY